MLFSGIISNIFWAFVVAIILWILCAFAGRLVNGSYRMPALLHLLCLAVAVPTVVFLFVFITCTKLHNFVTEAEAVVSKLMLDDRTFISRLNGQIAQTSTTVSTDKLTDFLAENFSDKIESKYPMLQKYADTDNWVEKIDLNNEFLARLSDLPDAEKTQKIVQKAVSYFTDSIRSKIKSMRRTAFITILLLQSAAFGIVLYKASRYRSPNASLTNYFYDSNEYL